MGKRTVFGRGRGGSDASLTSRGRGYIRRHGGMEATCIRRETARVNMVECRNTSSGKRRLGPNRKEDAIRSIGCSTHRCPQGINFYFSIYIRSS